MTESSGGSPRYLARASRALLLLAAVAVGALFYFAREVFIPVALALLFALVLSSAVEGLHRLRVPRAVSAILLLLILIVGIGAATDALIEPAQQWLASAPRTLQVVERKVRPVERWMHRLEGITHRAGEIGGTRAAPPGAPAAQTGSPINGSAVLSATGATLVNVTTIVILALFLLSGGPPMLARMAASLGSDLQTVHALRVIDAIRRELGRYYGTITLINLGLGAATAVAMLLLGMPSPYLWGAVAAVLNFIPYVGSATTLLLLAVVALVSFDDLTRVLAVVGSYLALATIEGQIVQPLLVGRRLDLNPILVFLAVWFGGWFWGVAGIVIAVPSLVALKVAAEHSEGAGAVVAFLSPSGSKTLESLQDRVSEVRERLRPSARRQ
ncbi:MAG TPA: AI-2E family transporter [Steroidobacteraceae bacterium]|nr:AI-2E family transporter [Steroidobacteraceae bacterium]